MKIPETSQQLSEQLTEVLLTQGEHMGDRLEFRTSIPELGDIKLNDYWNGFHKAHKGSRHYRNPASFYEEGNTPVLGLSIERSDLIVFTFRPSDISLRGMGTHLLRRLPEETKESNEILVTKNGILFPEPFEDARFEQMLSVF